VTVSQNRKRLVHDAQGQRVVCAMRFRFAGQNEDAGVCRGYGESMDFESEPADNK
jgi:hypothetical protein